MNNAKSYVIACGVLGRDLRRISAEIGMPVTLHFLPGGLHATPDKLRSTLQGIIDEISESTEWSRIIIGYGVCGRGTVDLQAGAVPLVIPKVHDCIALFLGGDAAYRRQFNRFPGTYYISKGWYEEKSVPASQQQPKIHMGDRDVAYDELVHRVGEQGARETVDFFSSWKRNYQRAVFIHTGAGSPGRAAAHARRMAEENGWLYEQLAGDLRLLSKMLTADKEDGEVLVVPPGHITYFDALSEGLSAKPVKKPEPGTQPTKPTNQWVVGDLRQESAELHLGLGIDAGGTYTDAVIFDFRDRRVVAKSKALTTRWDFALGICRALDRLDATSLAAVQLVAVSTTLATNAIVEREGQQVGLLVMPPDGIDNIDAIEHHPKAIIGGRLSISGQILAPIDAQQVRGTARDMIQRHGVDAFAVSGYAGHINPQHELQVKEILRQETGRFVCCGHELSNLLDFTVRAQTAVLNARIIPRLQKLIADSRRLFATLGIRAPIMVVRGDGSLMTARMAEERPVETILSGPAASTAGARFLTGCRDAVVVDIGGTTTDSALIADNTVRTSKSGASVGGLLTHVRAMDIRTTGLGGDSHVIHQEGILRVGPMRVGPLSWLASTGCSLDRGLAYLEKQAGRTRGTTKGYTLIALAPARPPENMTPEERTIIDLLKAGPISLLELVRITGALHTGSLPLRRLLECNALYRCALTPTDLLHAVGKLDLWDRDTAKRAALLTGRAAGLSVAELFHQVREQMVRTMAVDILKMHLDLEGQSEAIDHCPVCRQLLDHAFDKPSGPLQVGFQLTTPIIGIGAPAGFFLPRVARLLKAELQLPENQDVANAIGAVSSQVKVRRQVAIKPDTRGGYYIEGLAASDRFATLAGAEEAAVDFLLDAVRQSARQAGTSQTAVNVTREDRIAQTARKDSLFLERVLRAELSGPPDCLVQAETRLQQFPMN